MVHEYSLEEIKNILEKEKITLYRGVIENNISPLKDGRVQVRIVGIHDKRLDKIKKDDLPWAEIVQPTAFGFSSGIGVHSIPNNGTWVWLFLDHGNVHMPVIIGTISGKSTQASDPSVGFNDPDGVYPLSGRLDEEDQNRLMRVDKLDETIHGKINDTQDIFIKTDGVSGANVSQTEPPSLSDLAKYPDNSVIETKSGHVIEIDDTPGNERIRIYHKSGSYTEYRPDGSKIEKSVGAEDHYIHVGDVQKHIQGYVKQYLEKNLEQIISGGVKQHIEMDNFQHISGFFQITADGHLELVSDVKIKGSLEVTEQITANKDISSRNEVSDGLGNLSSLRNKHDANVAAYNRHTHNGAVSVPGGKMAVDNRIKWGHYVWSNNPLGFKND